MLAQRELKDPLGFKWVEVHVKPIVRNDNDAGGQEEEDRMKNDAQAAGPAQALTETGRVAVRRGVDRPTAGVIG